MTDKRKLIGIFGGTFDPIHRGHLVPLQQAAEQAGVSEIALLPCHIPPHKGTPSASARQRLEMVELVCSSHPMFYPDDSELRRDTPSYSVETLRQKKQQNPQQTLCFFMGMDSLKSLNTWYQWQDILTYCHIVVCKRPGDKENINADVQLLLSQCQTTDEEQLSVTDAGRIFIADTQELDISATQIRHLIAGGHSIKHLVNAEVEKYIRLHKLYQTQSDKLSENT